MRSFSIFKNEEWSFDGRLVPLRETVYNEEYKQRKSGLTKGISFIREPRWRKLPICRCRISSVARIYLCPGNMPFHIEVFDANAATDMIPQFPEVQH